MIATNESLTEDIGSAIPRREVKRVDLLDSLVLENRRLKDTIEQQRGELISRSKLSSEMFRLSTWRTDIICDIVRECFDDNGNQIRHTFKPDWNRDIEDWIPTIIDFEPTDGRYFKAVYDWKEDDYAIAEKD